MTIEVLEQYYGMCSNIIAIEEEIKMLYSPVKSPIGSAQSSEPGDPTARNALRIIALTEKLENERLKILDLLEEIESWLMKCDDSEIVSIVRWHYILGLNWKQTNYKVYGFPDYYYARQKVLKYFDRISKISNSDKYNISGEV